VTVKPEAAPDMLGPYRCLRKLAVGGMGEVYLAEARGASGFKKRLVIKAVRPDREEEQEVIQAFLDEARVWALLTHPNIVPLYDCLWLEGRLCLVMEYVEGADLRELIQSASKLNRPVPAAIAVQIVAQVAAALHAAHEARGLDGVPLGIVHRDVSPHNVLVDRGGNARLCDFGIARSVLRLTRTRTGKFKGKFAYVSPEAIRGETVDRRADVFGLGVLLYELLALKRPFQADAPVALLRNILDNDPPAIRDVRHEASMRVAHVIERALAKEASARFPTAEAMRQALYETPEGQTFLPSSRLTDWFDGLTGVTGEWHETQPRFLDLAARSAARSMEDGEEVEGDPALPAPMAATTSLAPPVPQLPAVEPSGPWLPPVGGLDDQTEPAFIPATAPDSSTDPGNRPPYPIPEAPTVSARSGTPRATPRATPQPRPKSPVPGAPAKLRAATPKPPLPVARPQEKSLFREYGPWVVGGLSVGATLTWLVWRLTAG
jgi:eukaryotic-like serine/threonine-protein kinase